MNLFKHQHFKHEINIWAVRWYCKYGISYRDLEEMLTERGVKIDHTTNLSMGSILRSKDSRET